VERADEISGKKSKGKKKGKYRRRTPGLIPLMRLILQKKNIAGETVRAYPLKNCVWTRRARNGKELEIQ